MTAALVDDTECPVVIGAFPDGGCYVAVATRALNLRAAVPVSALPALAAAALRLSADHVGRAHTAYCLVAGEPLTMGGLGAALVRGLDAATPDGFAALAGIALALRDKGVSIAGLGLDEGFEGRPEAGASAAGAGVSGVHVHPP